MTETILPCTSQPCHPYVWEAGHMLMLKNLVEAGGMPYRDIAKAINKRYGTAYTKNSIVGKVSRLREEGYIRNNITTIIKETTPCT